MKRDFPLKEQLAAALRDMMVPDGDGGWERAIPWEHARDMTSDQVLSLFRRDHYPIRYEMGGPNVHWNCQWLFKGDHDRKTAKKDQPEIAKSKRITAAQKAFQSALLAKGVPTEESARAWNEETDSNGIRIVVKGKPKAKIKSRGFQKGQRKLEGRSSWPKKAPK
jgi:hypothetical protein